MSSSIVNHRTYCPGISTSTYTLYALYRVSHEDIYNAIQNSDYNGHDWILFHVRMCDLRRWGQQLIFSIVIKFGQFWWEKILFYYKRFHRMHFSENICVLNFYSHYFGVFFIINLVKIWFKMIKIWIVKNCQKNIKHFIKKYI